jgi:hypothetical protein
VVALRHRIAQDCSCVTKYVLVDAELLDALLKDAPKALKPRVAAVKHSAKGVNPKAIELLGLINDFMEKI